MARESGVSLKAASYRVGVNIAIYCYVYAMEAIRATKKEALEQRHVEISYDPQETYAELATKCEQARNEMRRYDEEIEVLITLKLAFSRLTMPQEVPQLESPIEEQVAWFTLALQPKYLVKEKRIRELLKILGLPEERVRAIKRPGSKTDYDLVKM